MPELPEVEVLVRHLAPLIQNQTIRKVEVRRARVIAPTLESELQHQLVQAKFTGLTRRGKYLLFELTSKGDKTPKVVVGHLGMTGRMYLQPAKSALPKHSAVVLDLGRSKLIFEDTRYFGRFTLDKTGISKLGPEPLGPDFTVDYFLTELKRSSQAIKVKLLDQTLVAGIGNIYASEALFRAGVSPRVAANRLKRRQVTVLWQAMHEVLIAAITSGSTLPLDFAGIGGNDGLFYYGTAGSESGFYRERLLVYDRRDQPCPNCQTPIRRIIQAARSTFFCPFCQRQ